MASRDEQRSLSPTESPPQVPSSSSVSTDFYTILQTRRRFTRDESVRKERLETDPLCTRVEKSSVECLGCHRVIQLDKRTAWSAREWVRHRDKCRYLKYPQQPSVNGADIDPTSPDERSTGPPEPNSKRFRAKTSDSVSRYLADRPQSRPDRPGSYQSLDNHRQDLQPGPSTRMGMREIHEMELARGHNSRSRQRQGERLDLVEKHDASWGSAALPPSGSLPHSRRSESSNRATRRSSDAASGTPEKRDPSRVDRDEDNLPRQGEARSNIHLLLN